MSIYKRMEAVREELYDLSKNERNGTRKLTAEEMADACHKLYAEMIQLEQDVFELRTTGNLPEREPLRRPGLTVDPIFEYGFDQTREAA